MAPPENETLLVLSRLLENATNTAGKLQEGQQKQGELLVATAEQIKNLGLQLSTLVNSLDVLHEIIHGNGEPGLRSRIKDLERATKEAESRSKEISKNRLLVITMMSGFGFNVLLKIVEKLWLS